MAAQLLKGKGRRLAALAWLAVASAWLAVKVEVEVEAALARLVRRRAGCAGRAVSGASSVGVSGCPCSTKTLQSGSFRGARRVRSTTSLSASDCMLNASECL